jgi:hypothetical protein
MATKKELLEAIERVIWADAMWMAADGAFPHPEYDRYGDEIGALATVAGLDRLEILEECRKIQDKKEESQSRR